MGCVLGQNVFNENIFLIYWWWFMVLFFVSASVIVNRIRSFSSSNRKRTLAQKWRKSDLASFNWIYCKNNDKYQGESTLEKEEWDILEEHFLDIDHIGDWYMLKQLGENVDSYYFRLFVKALVVELKPSRPMSEDTMEMGALLTEEPNNTTWVEPSAHHHLSN